MSWREFEARKRIWAEDRAEHFNGLYDTKGVPWIAEDFLGTSSREERRHAAMWDRRAADAAEIALSSMKPGDTDGVPLAVIPMKDRKPRA